MEAGAEAPGRTMPTLMIYTMGDMLDWEDCSGTGHSSAGVIPTAVIAAEVLKKSGKDLLTAVVARVRGVPACGARGRYQYRRFQYFCLPVLMKLLDLSEEQMNQAFGIWAACSIIPWRAWRPRYGLG